jgi:predicted DsbA family dithiol-disulfide isomerase
VDPEPEVPLDAPLRIRLHYDFASSVCYIAHRVLARIAPRIAAARVELVWTPIDLALLMGWKRGGSVAKDRLDNVARIASELNVKLRTPPQWLDSRRAAAVAIALGDGPGEPAWRERVWTAVFEAGHFEALEGLGQPEGRGLGWIADLAVDTSGIDEARIEAGLAELEERTRNARQEMVIGVPTFMLDSWPFGGIQDDETMVAILTRFSERRRERFALQPGDEPA